MEGASIPSEKICPECGRGLARTHGPETPCALCVRFGPPSIRRRQLIGFVERTYANAEETEGHSHRG